MTEFQQLEEVLQNLKPYDDLWKLAENFSDNIAAWMQQPSVFSLDPEVIEREVKIMFTTSMKLNFLFNPHLATGGAAPKNHVGPGKVIKGLVDEIKIFQTRVPLVRAICNPGLKTRHWQEITAAVGFEMGGGKEVSLTKIIDLDVGDHLVRLEEISEAASKEFAIEKILSKMREDWALIQVELKDWKDTGTCIVSGKK